MGQRQTKPPQDIAEFRKLQERPDHFEIPEIPQKRNVTDLKCTIILAVCLLLSLIFIIYTLCYSDIRRFTHGYDQCGNVCGYKNEKYDGIECSGQNKENEPYLRMKEVKRSNGHSDYVGEDCVVRCPGNTILILGRCFPAGQDNNDNEISSDISRFFLQVNDSLKRSAGVIVALCFIGMFANIGMLLLFRFFPAIVVWIILGGSLAGFIALTIFLWVLDVKGTDQSNKNDHQFRYLAIFFTVLTIVLLVLLIFLFKRIKLVIRLFKQAMKTIFDIPLILAEPLLTFIAFGVMLLLLVFLTLLMSTSGTLQEVKELGIYEFELNGAMIFAVAFNVIMVIWMGQFIIGCQHMVVSGAVSAHYFSRDKLALTSPIYNSFYNLVRFHLGTVAFGSLIITVVALIKAMIKSLCENKYAKIFVDCCLGAIEDFLKYLSKNAYIQTAMHGQAFFQSGKRAVRLLVANAISAIAVNYIGDFVMFMAKLLIILFTILIGIALYDYDIPYFWAGIVIAVFITAILSECIFSVFETTIDTLFLCSCEDMTLNDGMTRPYYMTTDFMQYVEDAKAATKKE